ncbi:leader peptide processing enzyme [Lachnospiraceae bacterium KM106-2]|nr:leader peptide processing enzyme [Lachnospiraceae bacterium KM106-2]
MFSHMMIAVLIIGLGIAAYWDFRYQEISAKYMLAFWITIFMMKLVSAEGFTVSILLGEITGGVLLLISRLFKNSVGTADGIILCITGIVLGGIGNLVLLFHSLLIGAIGCIFLMVFRSYGRKSTIPFIPCIFLAYFGSVIF